MTFKSCILASVATALVAFPSITLAQSWNNADAASQPEYSTGQAPKAFPSIVGIPSAFPAPQNSGFVGFTVAAPRGGGKAKPNRDNADGDLGIGYTVGNPIDNISVTGTLVISDIQPFGKAGSFYFDFARALHVGERSLTFGGITAGNVGAWGSAKTRPETYSAYVSHLTSFQTSGGEIPVQVTVGYGDQTTFSSNGATVGEGLFYGLGLGVTETVAVSLSGTKNQVNVGTSFGVKALPEWGGSIGIFDVGQSVNRRQYAISISRSF
ncbi:hypothetical protein [Sagittula sp. S175]|uniref:hypothetical protein n=1 Tax=Sagittula sp. S175 TaxID=3415129 RepID=UPI003C7D1F4C